MEHFLIWTCIFGRHHSSFGAAEFSVPEEEAAVAPGVVPAWRRTAGLGHVLRALRLVVPTFFTKIWLRTPNNLSFSQEEM
jgi:hypothetical protein